MASIAISATSLAALKKELRYKNPDILSSHLSEALAHALGRRTYAALLVDVEKNKDDPCIELLHDELFRSRLLELGYPNNPEFCFELLKLSELISTKDQSADEIEYKSTRRQAWRNLMVLGVNEGIRQKLFSLRPGDNRWPGSASIDPSKPSEGCVYDFNLPNGLPARGYVSDAGFDELNIHVSVNPNGREWIKTFNAGFEAGDVFGYTWLERNRGAWIQTSMTTFQCRKALLKPLAELAVEPIGFGDRGRVIM